MLCILWEKKMNRKYKLSIDRIVGYGLCLFFRIPALVLEWILRRQHEMPPLVAPKKIVVAKYLGIGSIIQSTPMLKGLKNKYPDTQLIFVSLISNKNLLLRYDFIDKVLFVDDSSFLRLFISSIRLIKYLIIMKIDIFFDLEVHSTYGSLMCLFSCSKNRLGFSTNDRDYKAFIYTHMLYLNTNFPIRYCYIQLGQLAAMDRNSVNGDPLCPSLHTKDVEHVSQLVKMKFDFEHKGIIAINPNASDLRYERRWSRAKFAEVAKYFSKQGYAVALVGSAGEHGYVQGIIELLDGDCDRVRNVAGVFPLLEFFVFLSQCSLVITNDSGVMNMAMTMPIPQLLLAGPVNPEQYFIPNEIRTYIYYQTFCSPCTHFLEVPPCAGDNMCMKQIGSEEVIFVCERLLRHEVVSPIRRMSFNYNSEVLGVIKDRGRIMNTNKET